MPAVPRASATWHQNEEAAAHAAKAKAAKDVNPAVALALLTADVAARLFCLSILWMLLIIGILLSNAALCTALIHR